MLQEVQTFLYREARLLELNRFDEWLELFTDDVRYWMPVREEVQGQEGTGGGADSFSLYDDDKKSLSLRVTRIQTGAAHSEVPASVTQRLITNILTKPA